MSLLLEPLLVWAGALAAAVPGLHFLANLLLYRPAPPARPGKERIGVVIPARDEAANIEPCLESVLACRMTELEVIVVDDHSRDGTGEIVRRIAAGDGRVRLLPAPPLPAGWCGKQHACQVGAGASTAELLLFLDADLRLAREAPARLAAFQAGAGAPLVSAFPRQRTGSLGEALVIPLMHFILLGFLPLVWMRRSVSPGFGAGCGQLFLARREIYRKVGGHGAIRASRHDGLRLPRAFRRRGHMTDLCDGTDLASVRMYSSWRELWEGLAKNATEGMAAPRAILFWTVTLLLGQVLVPLQALALLFLPVPPGMTALVLGGTSLVLLPRLAGVLRFRQPLVGALLHPFGIVLFLAIQWVSLAAHLRGRPATWRGRSYGPEKEHGEKG